MWYENCLSLFYNGLFIFKSIGGFLYVFYMNQFNGKFNKFGLVLKNRNK